jgi:hypothetical protein
MSPRVPPEGPDVVHPDVLATIERIRALVVSARQRRRIGSGDDNDEVTHDDGDEP